MLEDTRARIRELQTVQRLTRNLAWEGTKLVAFLALREGVQRVLAGPLEADIDCPALLRVGEPFDAKVTVSAPFELDVYEIYFEDQWRAGERNGVGRREETWRLIPHTPGLRPITVLVRDREGNRIRRTRWVPVLPPRSASGTPATVEIKPTKAPVTEVKA